MPKIGIIGGSGLYKIDALKDIKEIKVATPFGEPSDSYITGKLEGIEIEL
jgi:5'-methylthioadenosine phosphorylase